MSYVCDFRELYFNCKDGSDVYMLEKKQTKKTPSLKFRISMMQDMHNNMPGTLYSNNVLCCPKNLRLYIHYQSATEEACVVQSVRQYNARRLKSLLGCNINLVQSVTQYMEKADTMKVPKGLWITLLRAPRIIYTQHSI